MKSTEKNDKAATGIVIIPISPEAEKCKVTTTSEIV